MKKLMLMVLVFNVSNTWSISSLFKSSKEKAYQTQKKAYDAISEISKIINQQSFFRKSGRKNLDTTVTRIMKTIEQKPQFFNDNTSPVQINRLRADLNFLIDDMSSVEYFSDITNQLKNSLNYINKQYPKKYFQPERSAYNPNQGSSTLLKYVDKKHPFEDDIEYRQLVENYNDQNYVPQSSGRSLAGSRLTPEQRKIVIEAEQKAKKAQEALEAQEALKAQEALGDEGVYPADLYDQKGEPLVNGTTPSTEAEQYKNAQNDSDPKYTDGEENGEMPDWYGW